MMVRLIIVCLLSVVVICQHAPDFSRQEDGSIRVTIPGFPGVTIVKQTVHSQGKQLTSTMTRSAVDGYFHSRIPDFIAKNDGALHYIIEYHLQNSVHKTKGLIHTSNEVTETTPPVTPRFLRRRATIVFFDDFSSGTIDRSKWNFEVSAKGGGNEQFNMYTPEAANAFIKNHILYIKPTLTVDHFGEEFLAKGDLDVNATWGTCTSHFPYGCHVTGVGKIAPVMSAKLKSIGTGHIRYGKVTVRAKMPKGDWLWPAIWMMPTESHYGGWPRSGEIDIIETRGNRNYHTRDGHSHGQDYDQVNIHYGNGNRKKSHPKGYQISGTTFGEGFHSYWIDWTESYIRLGVDDHTILAWDTPSQGYWDEGHFGGHNIWASGGKDAPFDRPFYLILNVAVGGRWFSHKYVNEPYPQPWGDNSHNKSTEFWNARHLWEPTWHGDDVAMKVDSVTMEQY